MHINALLVVLFIYFLTRNYFIFHIYAIKIDVFYFIKHLYNNIIINKKEKIQQFFVSLFVIIISKPYV